MPIQCPGRPDPSQLPPRTDDAIFLNFSTRRVMRAEFTFTGPGCPPGPIDLAAGNPINPGEARRYRLAEQYPGAQATRVECEADVGQQLFEWDYHVSGAEFLCSAVFGVLSTDNPAGQFVIHIGEVVLNNDARTAINPVVP